MGISLLALKHLRYNHNMNWVFFAVLSPAVYSVVNFVDKYILSKQIKDYRGISLFAAIMAMIFGTTFWLLFGMPPLSASDSLLIILSGVLTFFAQVLYFKALSSEETSKIIILYQMGPILVLVLSLLFLKEVITATQFAGFFLIMLASIGVSLQGTKTKLQLSKSFFLILLNQFLWSLAGVLFKFVVDQNSFVKVVAYESWGIALGGLLLFMLVKNIRDPFLRTFNTLRKGAIFFVFLNEGIFIIARLLTFLALSLGPLSLVSVIGSTGVFFGIIFGTVLTLLAPKVFTEDISKSGLSKKIGFALLAFIGIYLIYK